MTIQLLIVPYFVCREKRRSSFYNHYSRNDLLAVFYNKEVINFLAQSLYLRHLLLSTINHLLHVFSRDWL